MAGPHKWLFYLTRQGTSLDMSHKYPLTYKASSKTTKSIQLKFQQLISQYRLPNHLFNDNRPLLSSEIFAMFMANQHIKHIASSLLCSRSNGLIKREVKGITTGLTTTKSSVMSLETLILKLWSTPVGPYMLSPCEILHNRTQVCPGQPKQPVNFEETHNYFISKKTLQKDIMIVHRMINNWQQQWHIYHIKSKWQATKTLSTHQLQ